MYYRFQKTIERYELLDVEADSLEEAVEKMKSARRNEWYVTDDDEYVTNYQYAEAEDEDELDDAEFEDLKVDL